MLQDAHCVYLSQRKYIRDLLSIVEMVESKGIDTPNIGIKPTSYKLALSWIKFILSSIRFESK